MEAPRLQITEGMRRFLNYPRFQGPTRVLILETGYFFDQSWVRTAEALGWAAVTVPSVITGALSREDITRLFTTLGEFKPDFILTSNYAGMDAEGLFARFFEDACIPYVSWFTDTPRMILYGRKMHVSPYAVAATWDRAYTSHFEALGFEHILYMPLATDPVLFHGTPADTFEGTGLRGQFHDFPHGEAIEKHAHLSHVLDAVIEAFDEGRVTRQRFSQGVGAILDQGLLSTLNASELRNVELLINYEATQRQRVDLVQRMAPLGVEVRGDPHWLQVHDKVGGQVGYFDDLAPFYRNTAVNLNTTALQMPQAVNQRVFDCPAAGGFLVTDAQSDLFEHFDPETEVVVYHSLDELEDQVRYYLKHPEARRQVILSAQRRIAAEHTHAHRLQKLETFLKKRYA